VWHEQLGPEHSGDRPAVGRGEPRGRGPESRRRGTESRADRTPARGRRAPVTTPTTIVTTSITSTDALTAIQKTVDALNTAFNASVSSGVMNSVAANQWVGYGTYSGNECVSFEMSRGQGVVSEHVAVHPETLRSTPGWVDPVVGRVPQGRIFQMAVDEIQTNVSTGAQRGRTLWIHVTVLSDGNARLLLRCR
jgi:hypothetical protein